MLIKYTKKHEYCFDNLTGPEPSPLTEAKPNCVTEAKPNPTTEVKPSFLTETKPSCLTEAKLSFLTETKPRPPTGAGPSFLTEAKPNLLAEANLDNFQAGAAGRTEVLQLEPPGRTEVSPTHRKQSEFTWSSNRAELKVNPLPSKELDQRGREFAPGLKRPHLVYRLPQLPI